MRGGGGGEGDARESRPSYSRDSDSDPTVAPAPSCHTKGTMAAVELRNFSPQCRLLTQSLPRQCRAKTSRSDSDQLLRITITAELAW